MKNLHIMKKADIPIIPFDTGEGNDFRIDDTVGKNYDLPFTFGVAEVYPSKGIDFDYDDDGAICYCTEGTIKLFDPETNEEALFEEGDVIYIPREKGKIIVWSTVEYAKFVFVTYPHWR